MAKKKVDEVIEQAKTDTLKELQQDIRNIMSAQSLSGPFDMNLQMKQLYDRLEQEMFQRFEKKLSKYATEVKVGSHVTEIIKLIAEGSAK